MAHTARVAHHVRGRIRVKIPGAKSNPAVLDEIKQALLPLAGVNQIDLNPAAGSLVVHYHAESEPGDFHARLVEHGAASGAYALLPPEVTEVDQLARKIEAEAEYLSAHSESARVIVEGFKNLDRQVKIATHNAVDLKVLLPLGLAVYSLFEIGLEASTPLWVTLGIFSFNSFLALHPPPPMGSHPHSHVDIAAEPTEPASGPRESVPGQAT